MKATQPAMSLSHILTLPERAISRLIGKINPYHPDMLSRDGIEPIHLEESRIKGNAARLFAVGFVIFALWAVLAPLDSGANATGTVVVLGNRKAVQHPSGGVIESIAVREGSTVKQGEPLIKLNRLNIEAALNSTELEYINVLAVESRLISERDRFSSLKWLPELEKLANDSRVMEAKAQQIRLFESRKLEIEGQLRILREQIAGMSIQITEMQKIIEARKEQLAMMAEEARSNRELAAEGFVPKSRANEVERARSDLLASIASTMSEIGKTYSSIAATRLQLNQTLAVFMRDLETQLAEAQKSRGALRTKVDALQFDLGLTELRAPVDGTIVGLKVNTIGGVIQAGEVLMEIVPKDESLIVEAKVSPELIDKVKVGLEADMRFSAFNQNTTPVIPGKVKMVGADRLPATSKDQPFEYYLAQIETTAQGYELLDKHKVQAGMPVDVVIKTGERSFISYLFKPLTDRFALAFKEN
jgi:protease secretion system membrane fusion protein